MSTLDPSMAPMLDMFIYETSTLLEQLDELMLEAEKSKTLSDESINEIFRIMHTVKGSAAMMGIENISHLAHSIEDMFFIIRNNPEKLNENTDIFDLIFQSSDFLKAELSVIVQDVFELSNCDSLLNAIKAQLVLLNQDNSSGSPAINVVDDSKSDANDASSDDSTRIQIFFDYDCQMENIRSFMLISEIAEACQQLESTPKDPEKDASLSEEISANGLILKFSPSSALAEVEMIIAKTLSVRSYKVLGDEASTATQKVATVDHVSTATSAASTPQQSSGQTPSQANSKNAKQSLMSVSQAKLDLLMDLVGEIVIAESMVLANQDLAGLKLDNFYKSTRHLSKLTDELQYIVMSMKMVPLSGVFLKMQRLLRDTAKKLDKQAQLITIGEDTEVDKTINDIIADPLMHMVRNSIDHAIESPKDRIAAGKPQSGTVTLSAQNIGGEIVIEIADDGKGLDTVGIMNKARKNNLLTKPESEYTESEIFHMIMLPGFSTNEAVTEYSGRGVGMDVVSSNIETVGGTISIESEKGVGTIFTIKIPLTLAIVDGMEIQVGDMLFTLPITSIKQSFKITAENEILHDTDKSEMIMVRGECYPIIRLYEIYDIPNAKTDLYDGIAVLIENNQRVACLFVDEVLRKHQVVVKPFPSFLGKYNLKNDGLAGCTILGDGSVSLILDGNSLLKRGEK